ncbi:MAG: heavy metal-binding domain-containing protein, partial [Acidobacteriota bacterium]
MWILLLVCLASPLVQGGRDIQDTEAVEVWLCPVHQDEQSKAGGRCPV